MGTWVNGPDHVCKSQGEGHLQEGGTICPVRWVGPEGFLCTDTGQIGQAKPKKNAASAAIRLDLPCAQSVVAVVAKAGTSKDSEFKRRKKVTYIPQNIHIQITDPTRKIASQI